MDLFANKKEKWAWIKANTPDIAKLILDISQAFGKPAHVEIIPTDPSALIAARERSRQDAADKALTEIRGVVG